MAVPPRSTPWSSPPPFHADGCADARPIGVDAADPTGSLLGLRPRGRHARHLALPPARVPLSVRALLRRPGRRALHHLHLRALVPGARRSRVLAVAGDVLPGPRHARLLRSPRRLRAPLLGAESSRRRDVLG